ncbi:hypothetical protein F3Y22_tig00109925pilonHSYRG00022 [Hibiscus syriacus]|uniref:Bromo domain-containing protein n=1 Tax=Hibiscus syriacus TaxID=106335 RepID=A0A6A3BWL7_HIBSY|nr:hypothetical protein F3Y22_tig00109925pilonHSYRG00022 [Hibiscus syriacus]
MIAGRWGTWEELLLGGAVLRHGARDWNLVASELRTRTISPSDFTPEVCKAKYEDLQQRYSGCTAWFEELRKQRMAELRRALEQSEDSIGSLELKLESLKAEKRDNSPVGYDCSQTESVLPCPKSQGVAFSSKDTYKDGLSAGSFTQEAETKWAPDCPVPATVPAEDMDSKPGNSPTSAEAEKIPSIDNLADAFLGGQLRGIKKKRGKRKRNVAVRMPKKLVSEKVSFLAHRISQVSHGVKKLQLATLLTFADLQVSRIRAGILARKYNLNIVLFSHSEKRKIQEMILRHIDFDTIRSRIGDNSIISVRELFRDMLLVANNALVFYSKNTREYKSALLLRHIVTATLRQHFKEYGSKVPITTFTSPRTMHKPPAKPRSIRPGNRKQLGNATNNRNQVVGNSHVNKKPTNASSPPSVESLAVTKKVSARPKKGGCGRANQKSETPAKGRKRTRAR